MTKKSSAHFLEDLNKFRPNIKFTYVTYKESIHFLGINVRWSDGKNSTDLCVKTTDRPQFLHYTSSHPDITKGSIVFSQALRFSRIFYDKSDFLKILKKRSHGFWLRDMLRILLKLR